MIAGAEPPAFRYVTRTIDITAFSGRTVTIHASCIGRSISIWEVATGREVRHLEQHKGNVFAVAFSPDGRRLLSASGPGSLADSELPIDNSVRVFDVKQGEEVIRFEGHTRNMNAVAHAPDGRHAVSGSSDRTSAHGRCRIRSVDKLDNVDAEQRRYRRPADVTRLGGGTGLIVAFRKNWPFSTHPDSPAERTRIQLPFVSPICTGVSGPIITTVREPELAALRTLTQPRTVALLQRTVAGRAGVVRRATGGGLGVAFATARGGGAAAIGAGAEGGGAATGVAATGGATTGVVSTGAETGCASDGAGDSSCVAPVDAVPVTESPLVATVETESERAESMVVAATFAESVLRSVYAGTTTTAPPSGFESAIAGGAMGVDFAHHAPHTRPQNASVAAVPQTTARNGNVAGAVPHRIHFPFFRG